MPAQAGIQYSETSAMESRTRGVLDTPPSRGYDGDGWSIIISVIARSVATKQSSSSVAALDCFAPLAMTVLDALFEIQENKKSPARAGETGRGLCCPVAAAGAPEQLVQVR
jgi:hypothetical protein